LHHADARRHINGEKVSEIDKYVKMAKDLKFLDGYYFSFAIRYCKLCKSFAVDHGKPCPTPEKVRSCDQSFGIDVYKTVRNLGLPCEVLHNKKDVQNRYGFVLIE
jgi:predicted metal-binding protein